MSALTEDLAELQAMVQQATRPAVQAVLRRHIEVLEKQVAAAQQPAATPGPAPRAAAAPGPTQVVDSSENTIALTKFAWDQASGKVKAYIDMPDGVEGLTEDMVSVSYQPRSVEVVIRNLHGKSYRFYRKLFGEIDKEKSSVKVKTSSVVVSLKKVDTKHWDQLHAGQKDAGFAKLAETGDPSESIMGMMKKLYEEGDDEMKRTIAKAWTEQREKPKKAVFGSDDEF
eukprot:CAMPEP_0204276682 /NCGR_PEP_ID=MMETSP0468-20130131/28621_1 /ASSEMBLY_ACC=CAM_ASM_000383 /TAXON_ID=2969 /ORGANISM="Oxyrrhis marina" /LENGTH=226 /DNA_ID=CAMNT_0051253347 /DNA_START=29 /DNA_END=709 /DNA_ORIENTATION=+